MMNTKEAIEFGKLWVELLEVAKDTDSNTDEFVCLALNALEEKEKRMLFGSISEEDGLALLSEEQRKDFE